ncbi:MAG: tyrosine-type recombinase/integrase, partial [Rhodoblastus sp.]|nr:tyrosine-type recombinase/integrase [Rhodoblastus sp.]
SYLKELTDERKAIVFPPSAGRRKRTGVIPVTSEIERTIVDIAAHLGVRGSLDLLAEMDVRLFPVSGNVLGHAWRQVLDRLGIADLRFHDLRHEATSRLFERGLSAAEVMSITGHSTSEMVDRYSHYSSALVLDRLEGRDAPKSTPEKAVPDRPKIGARINSVAGKSPEAAALIEDISRLLERLAALHG